ncbi:hypothetical protein ACFOY4_02160 [Actinomadura syzygii]|uniref:Nucleotidyltransferase family protein n=1 Tax=Actinomadura syzygii TaxID=1427538 RepID=A0A5D0TY12_9ACTN|nr:hypothetical protein [Actinomadura syzygii]TYC10266.1 hypothetical protein FXF65_30505 [Actinomadura syzygii]
MTHDNGSPAGLLEHPLLRRLAAMDLDPDDFVIFGSGPLLAHGLRRGVSDLDIVARNHVWDYAYVRGVHGRGRYSGDMIVSLWGGRLQFSRQWIPGARGADELIDDADVFGGLRFAPLRDVLAYKLRLRRPKDLLDISTLSGRLREEAGYGPRASSQ